MFRQLLVSGPVCIAMLYAPTKRAYADCTIPTQVSRSAYSVTLNLPYTTTPNNEQSLDLYLPSNVTNPPVIMTIHGGGFRHGDKSGDSDFAKIMATFGIATAALNYRLTIPPANLFPAGISDIRCAATWLQANATTLGIDGTRFAVMGGSAGGNLAALLGLGADPEGAFDATADCAVPTAPPAMLGVADYYGLNEFDKRKALNRFQTVIGTDYLGIKPERDKPLAAEASPITYVSQSQPLPPFFVARGTDDQVMPEPQARDMARVLKANGGTEQYWDIPGLGHAFGALDVVRYPILQKSGCALVAFYLGAFGMLKTTTP